MPFTGFVFRHRPTRWVHYCPLGALPHLRAERGNHPRGVREHFAPEFLHPTLLAAIRAKIDLDREHGAPGDPDCYGDGLYAEVEVSDEAPPHPGVVSVITTGRVFVASGKEGT